MSGPGGTRSDGAVLGRGFSRFAQLLAVGFAWGGPLLFAVFAGFGLGTPAHPGLARLFAHHGWPLLAMMLALASLGIALVATLMRDPARVRLIWLLVPAALAVVAVTPFFAPGRSFPVYLVSSLAAMAIPLIIVILGAVVTTVTFWHHSHWLAIVWLSLWIGTVAFLLYATAQMADSGGPGDGFVILPVLAALTVVIVLVAALASVLRGASDWTEHVRHIEQAHQPDAPERYAS